MTSRDPERSILVTPISLEPDISNSAGDTEIDTPFQSTTNRKWPMGYRMITWPMSSHDPERSNPWLQYA